MSTIPETLHYGSMPLPEGVFNFAVTFLSAKSISLVAAPSLEKCPLLRIALRTWLCRLSMAFMVLRACHWFGSVPNPKLDNSQDTQNPKRFINRPK